jgi:hypothetical protein
MPARDDALRILTDLGERDAAEHVRRWRNACGGTAGWDAHLKHTFPRLAPLLWPGARAAARPAALLRSGVTSARSLLRLAPGVAPAFDAYVAIDWSASSVPNTGADSVWWALAAWESGALTIESDNCRTRAALTEWLRAELAGRLRDRRTLVGFDFPLGYPRGFAAALGHRGPASEAWRFTWRRIAAEVRDAPDNANNRLDAAAALNAAVSGGFGPFYGRPPRVPDAVACHLSPRRLGNFEFPLRTRCGPTLAARRLADDRAKTSSSPWFVYGGGNSVGGQALVGIPRLHALREALAEAQVWPFETGARCPEREEARVVFAEIYPSIFHVRDPAATEVHDRLQVEAAARSFAALDAAGELAPLFAAPPDDPAVLHEEGWVLGVR